jgi:hypothetical protein
MDTVAADSKRETLRQRVEEAKAALLNAADASVIRNDPLCQHLNALALSVGAHYDIYCATEEAQQNVAKNVRRHAEILTKGALGAVRESMASLTKELGPQLLKAALPATQQALLFIKYRTIYWALLAMAALIVLSGMLSYAVGLNHGRYEGETAAHAIQAAMAAGPNAATDWALLMANNNPVPAMSACRKSIQADADGRRYCFLPVWLDPIAPPIQQ